MPRRYPRYTPPPLKLRVWVRDPAARPGSVDRYETDFANADGWGKEVWAAKRDRHARGSPEENVRVLEADSVFTIREMAGVAPGAEVVYGGRIYDAQGEPLLRGGVTGGRHRRFLEIVTKLRQ